MRAAAWMAALVCCHLLTGCVTASTSEPAPSVVERDITQSRLLILGRLWLPLPGGRADLWLDRDPTLSVIRSGDAVSYRVIDQKTITFIGSDKSPYDFMHTAFNAPASEVELVFLESFAALPDRARHTARGLEFYRFRSETRQKLYILAESLDFVVEVSIDEPSNEVIKHILAHARLEE